MIRSLALASLLLAPLPAQVVPFPGGAGSVMGSTVMAVTWENRPALLLMGHGGSLPNMGPLAAVTFGTSATILKPVFALRAVLAWDPRPCAVGQQENLINQDYNGWLKLGNIGPDGFLTWLGNYRVASDGWANPWHLKQYSVSQCWPRLYELAQCDEGCLGPRFVAMVLTIEGVGL